LPNNSYGKRHDLLPGVLLWALGQATSDEELDAWWRQHKPLIADLSEADRERLVGYLEGPGRHYWLEHRLETSKDGLAHPQALGDARERSRFAGHHLGQMSPGMGVNQPDHRDLHGFLRLGRSHQKRA